MKSNTRTKDTSNNKPATKAREARRRARTQNKKANGRPTSAWTGINEALKQARDKKVEERMAIKNFATWVGPNDGEDCFYELNGVEHADAGSCYQFRIEEIWNPRPVSTKEVKATLILNDWGAVVGVVVHSGQDAPISREDDINPEEFGW